MSQKFKSEVELQALNAATTDTDKFLVSDGGIIKFRTGAEMLSDLGINAGAPTSSIQHQVKAGVAINKGQAVYVSSADGTNMIVSLASNATEATSSKTMGLLTSTVAINGFANVIAEGLLAGLNTSTAVAGDPVWLGTGGNLIYGLANKPYAPAHLVFIGIVTRSNISNGEIFVKIQNGFELDELHDVDVKSLTPVSGHLLGFNGNLWVNKTIAGWLGYTPADASHTHTFDSLTSKTGGTSTYQTSGDFRAPIFYDSNNTGYYVDPASTSNLNIVRAANSLTGAWIGVENVSNTSGNGISLYNGAAAGIPTYGIMFAGTATFGTHGSVTSDWATYLTMSDTTTRGWIFKRGTTNVASISGSGILTVNGDVRSPIYYDSNNTAYYLDPASTSNLNVVTATMFNGRISPMNGTSTVIGQVQTSSSINMGIVANNYGYGISTNNAGGLDIMANQSGQPIRFWSGSINETPTKSADFNGTTINFYGNVTTPNQFIASSFADYDNTGFYLNPAGTSNITKLYHSDNIVATNYGYGQVGLYSSVRYQAVFSMGESYILPADGTSIGNLYGMAWSHPNAGGVAGNLNTHGLLVTENGTFLAAISGSIRSRDDMRAPIFYDSNNSGYYIDPSSTSNINVLTTQGNANFFSQLSIENQSTFVRLAFNKLTFWDWQGSQDVVTIDGGYLEAANSLRAPIFYDSNDTGFYLDPNSTTTSLIVAGAIKQNGTLARPSVQWGYAGNTTGAVVIKLPGVSVSNYGMIHAVIDVYEYNSNNVCTITIGGHNWSTQWYNYGAQIVGYTNKPVRLAVKDGKYCIVIGNSSSVWEYGQVVLRKIQNGTYYNNTVDLGGAYSIGIESDTYSWVSADLRELKSNSVVAVDNMYAPIYYDRNNTNYFTDPASTSVLNGLILSSLSSNDGMIENSSGAYFHLGGWGVGRTAPTAILVNTAYRSDISDYATSAGSAGNADTVDGYHASDLVLYKHQTVDMSNTGVFSASNYYPVTIPIGQVTPITIEIQNNLNSNVPSWATHGAGFSLNLKWTTNGSGWGTTEVKREVSQYHERFANQTICGGITQLTNASVEVVWLRGGGTYYFKFSRDMAATANSGTYTASGQSVSPTASAQNTVWNSNSGYENYYANNIFVSENIYSPVYYDNNNTAFYIDPASSTTSAVFFSKIQFNIGGSSASTLIQATSSYGTNSINTYYNVMHTSGDFYIGNPAGGAANLYGANANFNIFYDRNNTAYYFDGSSTGDSIRVAGDIVAYYSDDRLKDRKGNIENALEKVLSLNGFYYEANQKAQELGYKKKMEVGVSAQEVEAILPELIKDAPIGQGYKTLDYGRLTPLLIEAIKDQQKQIEELKELVNKLITK